VPKLLAIILQIKEKGNIMMQNSKSELYAEGIISLGLFGSVAKDTNNIDLGKLNDTNRI